MPMLTLQLRKEIEKWLKHSMEIYLHLDFTILKQAGWFSRNGC